MTATRGPWHEGYAVTAEVLGCYVTIVCTNPDIANAVADMYGTPQTRLPAQPALVSRLERAALPQKSTMDQWSRLGSTRKKLVGL